MHPAARAAQFLRHSPGPRPLARLSRARARSVPAELTQTVGPTAPAHPAPGGLPWTNLETQETVQVVKAASKGLREPLLTDMGDDEIFVSKDSIHILKHHGSYMQQDRSLKGKAKQESYQFMLRLKVPCGEVPGALYAELDDISNKWGHGDLRATTRQAFQLHGVLKSNLKAVIAAIANVGSNTYGGCGDISRNVMVPPVHFPNNPAYGYAQQYAKALADLFKPMTDAFASSVPRSSVSRKRFDTDASASSGHGWNQSITTQLTSAGKRRVRILIGSPIGEKQRITWRLSRTVLMK